MPGSAEERSLGLFNSQLHSLGLPSLGVLTHILEQLGQTEPLRSHFRGGSEHLEAQVLLMAAPMLDTRPSTEPLVARVLRADGVLGCPSQGSEVGRAREDLKVNSSRLAPLVEWQVFLL